MTTFHAAPSCPLKNVLFNDTIFTLTSAFSTKISSIIDSQKEMMTSVHSQKSVSAFDVQNILNTADFLCQHSNIYFSFRKKLTCDAAPYITAETSRRDAAPYITAQTSRHVTLLHMSQQRQADM
jgi:hypothetical protein